MTSVDKVTRKSSDEWDVPNERKENILYTKCMKYIKCITTPLYNHCLLDWFSDLAYPILDALASGTSEVVPTLYPGRVTFSGCRSRLTQLYLPSYPHRMVHRKNQGGAVCMLNQVVGCLKNFVSTDLAEVSY